MSFEIFGSSASNFLGSRRLLLRFDSVVTRIISLFACFDLSFYLYLFIPPGLFFISRIVSVYDSVLLTYCLFSITIFAAVQACLQLSNVFVIAVDVIILSAN